MRTALHVLELIAGIVIVVSTVISAVRSTILPRSVQNRLSNLTTLGVRVLFRLWVGRSPSYQRRDRIMAMLAPITLLGLLATWLVSVIGAYILIYVAVADVSWRNALLLSGSSVFTLGTTVSTRLDANLLSYTEAGLGLLLLTLLITYLPSIYGAFSRRENGVSLLRVRAGTPPRAVTLLIRYYRIEAIDDRLTELWRMWESWFVDVEESHTTFPILSFFRSPQPEQSWITSAGAILDSAAFWLACADQPRDPDAALCLRAGFQALQRIATAFELPFDADPAPDDPIAIGRDEWDDAMEEMADAGIALYADRDQAWRDWKGWRVNYDTVLLNLARVVEAPPAPWLSDRSPVGSGRQWTLANAVRAKTLPTTRAAQERRES